MFGRRRDVHMVSMRTAQVDKAGGQFTIVEQELPEPGPGQVRVQVEACGICHTDAALVDGYLPGVSFPLVPGHEVAGRIDALGPGVEGWAPGARVGVGWFGGCCQRCVPCRSGDFINCVALQVPGAAYPGGFADALVVPANALAAIPDQVSAVDAAPLMCAGATVFNALRASAARPGDLVAVLGIGGVGHLAVQYAARMGFETVAIARGAEKQDAARRFGARHYLDSTAGDIAAGLRELGGAQVVIATAVSSAAISAGIDGLAPRGQLVVVGAPAESLAVSPLQLIFGSRSVVGHASGTARESEEALAFAALAGIRPQVEAVPLEQVGEAFTRMRDGAARFRMVLTTGRS
jgi:alcohol dehydrogenase